MYVKRSIVIVLALLTSNTVFASDIGRAKTAYEGVKRQFDSDPLTYQNQINDALNAVITAINNARLNTTNDRTQRAWVTSEQNWINNKIAALVPTAPAGAPVLPTGIPVAGRTKLKSQADQMFGIMHDFDTAEENNDIAGMKKAYANALTIFPKLTLMSDRDKKTAIDQFMKGIEAFENNLKAAAAAKIEADQEREFQALIKSFEAAIDARDYQLAKRRHQEALGRFQRLDKIDMKRKNANLNDMVSDLRTLRAEAKDAEKSNKLDRAMAQFNAAYAQRDAVKVMQIYPQVDRAMSVLRAAANPSEAQEEQVLLIRTQYGNIETLQDCIDDLFQYISDNKRGDDARIAESILIRILKDAPKNASILEQQNTLTSLIFDGYTRAADLQDQKQRAAILQSSRAHAFDALQDMRTGADKPRTAPITDADRAIKAF